MLHSKTSFKKFKKTEIISSNSSVHEESESESEVAQLCPTLCDPMDGSLPGSTVLGIFQARILEWAAISFSGDHPHPGIEPGSPALQTDALPSELPGNPNTS